MRLLPPPLIPVPLLLLLLLPPPLLPLPLPLALLPCTRMCRFRLPDCENLLGEGGGLFQAIFPGYLKGGLT